MQSDKQSEIDLRIDFLKGLESFFNNYDPKFGEKIKLRRFQSEIEKWKLELLDLSLKNQLKKINVNKLSLKEIKLIQSLGKNELRSYLHKIKREKSLPLILQLMEKVNPTIE